MNKSRLLVASLVASLIAGLSSSVLAQNEIAGTWAGMLPAGDTTLEIHFVLTPEAGGYSTLLTSPNPDGIQDLPATSTSFENGRLVITVDDLAGRYEGTVGDGRITGNWIQQGTEIPLELVPYVEASLSEAAQEQLRGSWVGDLTVQALTLAIVVRFEDNEAGEFVGFLDSPDQGANGLPAANIRFADGSLSFEIPQIVGSYTGTVAGDGIDGTFTQLGMPLELDLTRGEYRARGVEMSQAVIERLEGSWVGRVQNAAGGTLAIVFRFETSDDGGLLAYLDSPEQGASGIPMSEIQVDGDQLSLEVPAAQASFTATLAAAEMTGTWAQGNMTQPVTMTRGEYTPTVTALQLADESMAQLAGTWRGTMGPLAIVLRFETRADGSKLGFLDVPAQGATGLAISEVTLADDQLTIAIPAVGATISGTLGGNQIEAQWRQGQANNPLSLTRDP